MIFNLRSTLNTPLYFEDDVIYGIDLVNFNSFQIVFIQFRINGSNNTVLWWNGDGLVHKIIIRTGSYEISSLINVLQKLSLMEDEDTVLSIEIILRTNRKFSFNTENSIGPVLGFDH